MALEAKPTCSQLGDITSTKKKSRTSLFNQNKQTRLEVKCCDLGKIHILN